MTLGSMLMALSSCQILPGLTYEPLLISSPLTLSVSAPIVGTTTNVLNTVDDIGGSLLGRVGNLAGSLTGSLLNTNGIYTNVNTNLGVQIWVDQ